jgi:hypothetical protein
MLEAVLGTAETERALGARGLRGVAAADRALAERETE